MKLLGRAFVMGALLLSGLYPVPATGQVPNRAGTIEELLDRRARAVLDEDRDAFMATVGGDRAFRDEQAAIFDRMTELPYAAFELEVDLGAYGDLARPSDVGRYPGAESVSIPLTVERYRFAGFDRRPVIRDHYFTFVQRDGGWAIESDSDLADLGFFSARAPWELSDITVEHSGDLLAVAGKCAVCVSPESLLSSARSASEHVDRWWNGRWNDRTVILIPSDSDDLARMIEATYPVDAFVAFAFWTGIEGDHPGPRIVVNPRGFLDASRDRIESILRHEMFHVATIPSSGPFVPRWIEEGFAQYVQYSGSDAAIAGADSASDGTLPDDFAFFSGGAAEILRVYSASLSATGFIVDRWGWDAAQRLYRVLGRRGNEAGTARFHQDDVVRAVLGVSLEDLERLWASSIGS